MVVARRIRHKRLARSSSAPMTVSAASPWRMALQREPCLLSNGFGPVLLLALRRAASICLKDVIADRPLHLASICNFGLDS
jgi:hypothetical protein